MNRLRTRLATCLRLLALPLMLAVAAPAAADATAPDQLLRETVDRVQTLIRDNADTYRADTDAFYAMIDREIVPMFDLPHITRLVLARHARASSPEQRRRFATALKNTLVRTYADAMLEYNDSVRTEWAPLRMAAGAETVTVQSRLLREDGPPIPVGFSMRSVDGGWKIFDITVEGISIVTNFRAQYNQEIRANGLDALIEKMESRDYTPSLDAAVDPS